MKKQLSNERYKLLHTVEDFLEGPMIFLGFTWLVLLVVELVRGLPATLEYLSLSIWVIFIIDFLIKLVLAPKKTVFIKKNWLTAISLILPALRIFRAFRFIRLFRGLRGIRLVRIVASLNRGIRSLGATMKRRAFGYVMMLSALVSFGGAAGMHALERATPGFESYWMSLWWTAMRIITVGNEFHPITPEGRGLAFLIAIFGFAIFGYVTATIASFFIGRDAEEEDAPVAGAREVNELKALILSLSNDIKDLKAQGAAKD